MRQHPEFGIFIFIVLVILMLWFYFRLAVPFLDRRAYLEMEKKRAGRKEYLFWKKELRKHYLDHIPFFGWVFRIIHRKQKQQEQEKEKGN